MYLQVLEKTYSVDKNSKYGQKKSEKIGPKKRKGVPSTALKTPSFPYFNSPQNLVILKYLQLPSRINFLGIQVRKLIDFHDVIFFKSTF